MIFFVTLLYCFIQVPASSKVAFSSFGNLDDSHGMWKTGKRATKNAYNSWLSSLAYDKQTKYVSHSEIRQNFALLKNANIF